MDFTDHVAAIRREGAALGTAAGAAGLVAAVPGCPGWTVADLVGHQGRLHRWVTRLLEERPRFEPGFLADVEVPGAALLLDWYAAGVEPLADSLEAAGPDAEVWSWTAWHTAGFWARRMAHETAVHRCDAESACGGGQGVAAIDAGLAVDGIDEALDMLPFRPGTKDLAGGGETIHLHCTDTDGEWLVRLDATGVTVTREHAKGDVAARGPASDLLLFLYGRAPVGALEVFGDSSLLTRWQRDAHF